MMAGRGDELPVSALPVDGTYPSGTTAYEKRNISELVAVWDPELCIQCGNCSFVCPHSVIRSRYYDPTARTARPAAFARLRSTRPACPTRLHAAGLRRGLHRLRPVRRGLPGLGRRRAGPQGDQPARREPLVAASGRTSRSSSSCRRADRSRVDFGTVRGTQFLEPLFEFSGACAGCGETPYLKLLSQLFGDRLTIANATGCSSIYGGNLPTTPWTTGADGRGPGVVELAVRGQRRVRARPATGRRRAHRTRAPAARELRAAARRGAVDAILDAPQLRESELRRSASGVAELAATAARTRRPGSDGPAQRRRSPGPAQRLDRRRRRLGLRHRLRRPRPRPRQRPQRQRAGARHRGVLQHRRPDVQGDAARRGRQVRRRRQDDARPRTSRCRRSPTGTCTSRGWRWAPIRSRRCRRSARPRPTTGPSLVIAYSHCIAHGFDMRDGLDQQYRAVASGHWPLLRYDPAARSAGGNPFLLDSPRPRMPLADYRKGELRFRALANAAPGEADGCSRPRPAGAPTSAGRPTRRWPPAAPRRFPADAREEPAMELGRATWASSSRNPLSPPASPLSAHARRRPAPGGRRRRRDRAVLAVRGAAARGGRSNAELVDGRPESFAGGRWTTSRPIITRMPARTAT